MTNTPASRWSGWSDADDDQVPPIQLMLTTRHITIPAEARALAVSAGLLAETFVGRMSRPDAGSQDGAWQLITRDLQAALDEHARMLEERIDRQVWAFLAQIEAGDADA